MVEGNLNQHAKDHHNGICIFIDTKIGLINIIHYPKNIVLKTIYINQFGEEVE